jgi:hypothetical protein
MDETRIRRPADALLLMAPGCAHCPVVLEGLAQLIKRGDLGRLEVVNIAAHPEAAEAVGSRSVPWCRIGPFELEGLHSAAELAVWAQHAAAGTGMTEYLAALLEGQRLAQVVSRIRANPTLLHDLIVLMADLAAPMTVRIGIGAVFEEMAELGLLSEVVPDLGALTRSEQPQTRADACHYLGLTGDGAARPYVQALLQDPDTEVQQIAAESLAVLPR